MTENQKVGLFAILIGTLLAIPLIDAYDQDKQLQEDIRRCKKQEGVLVNTIEGRMCIPKILFVEYKWKT